MHIRFVITFTCIAVAVGLLMLAGATPSAWTGALMVVASFGIAVLTAPERMK